MENFLWPPQFVRRPLQRKSREGGKGCGKPLTAFYIATGVYLAALMLVLGWWARFPR